MRFGETNSSHTQRPGNAAVFPSRKTTATIISAILFRIRRYCNNYCLRPWN